MEPITTTLAVADFILSLFGRAQGQRQQEEERKRQREANLAGAVGLWGEGKGVLRSQNVALTDTGFAVGEGTNRQIYKDTRRAVEDDILAALGVHRGSKRKDIQHAFFGAGAGGQQAEDMYEWVFGPE